MSHLLLHLSWIAAFVAAALLIGSQAFSQVTDPSQPTEPITLPMEVISATRYERPLSELLSAQPSSRARTFSTLPDAQSTNHSAASPGFNCPLTTPM